jgi:hypothetical protein
MKVANTMPVAGLGHVQTVATDVGAPMEEFTKPRKLVQSVPSEDKSTTDAASHAKEPAEGQTFIVPKFADLVVHAPEGKWCNQQDGIRDVSTQNHVLSAEDNHHRIKCVWLTIRH